MLFCVPARSTVHVDLGPAKDVRPHSFDFRFPHFLWVGLLGQLVEREADRALSPFNRSRSQGPRRPLGSSTENTRGDCRVGQ